MKQLIFIRHGATAGNLEKRYIGRTDEALCPLGIHQVEELKTQDFRLDLLFVSPMLRTRQSAEILFPDKSSTLVQDFRETDFGVFEGKTASELTDSLEYQVWLDSFCLAPIPQGESVDEFKCRCCSAFVEIISSVPEDSTTAFVVHGGVIMAILERFAEPKRDFYDYHIGNGKYICCFADDVNKLHIISNETI